MVWPLIIGAAVTLYEGNRNRKAKKDERKEVGATAIQLQAAQQQQQQLAAQQQQRTLLMVGGIGAAALGLVLVLRR